MANAKYMGALSVTLHNAKDLIARDNNGKSDPFVKFHLFDPNKPTETKIADIAKSTVKKATLDPVWDDETYKIEVPRSFNSVCLRVEVFDWDIASGDDYMGECEILLDKLVHSEGKDGISRRTCRLTSSTMLKKTLRAQGISGTVELSVSYVMYK
ncbi:hypothetical protein CYMTET_20500, partial [Cymbomonas tetramitiformis]